MIQEIKLLSRLLLAGLLFLIFWLLLVPAPVQPRYPMPPSSAPAEVEEALFATHWVSRGATPHAHSASIVDHQGDLVAVWYGGTREGAADTQLFMARFVDGGWALPQSVMDRHQAAVQLHRPIRKLGNPVLHRWPDDALGIFFVSVSLGGWAMSSINYIETRDQGASWSPAQRLVSSPFLNVSTLVRSKPLTLEDGSVQLPVYHELAGKFAELLHISRQLRVLGKTRISSGKAAIQPSIAPVSEQQAVALLRYYSGQPADRVLHTQTDDGGLSWAVPLALELPNPGSSVALLRLDGGLLIAALNDLREHRYRLSLAVSHAGEGPWRVLHHIEHEKTEHKNTGEDFEFSYPSLLQDDQGMIHLVYTWNQQRIKHVVFNQAWLLEPSAPSFSSPPSSQPSAGMTGVTGIQRNERYCLHH